MRIYFRFKGGGLGCVQKNAPAPELSEFPVLLPRSDSQHLSRPKLETSSSLREAAEGKVAQALIRRLRQCISSGCALQPRRREASWGRAGDLPLDAEEVPRSHSPRLC